jgi:hypothetical protein
VDVNIGVKSGEFIVLTEGSYDEYCIHDLIIALKNFDMGEKAREFSLETGQYVYQNKEQTFKGWLIGKGLATPVEYTEINLGEYGDFDKNFGVVKPKK